MLGCVKSNEDLGKLFGSRDIVMSDGPENTGPLLEQGLPDIEQLCRKQGHLKGKLSLSELIKRDAKVLEEAGFDCADVLWQYRFMRATHARNSKFLTDERQIQVALALLHSYNPKWSLQHATRSQMSFAGHQFDIFCLVWGGAEECPFDQVLSPDKYFGYEYGDRDWIVIRDKMAKITFSDLVPNQGGKHGFFQDSNYRLDPVEFLEFFGYKKPHLDIIKSCLREIRAYRFISSPSVKCLNHAALEKAIAAHQNKEFAEIDGPVVTVGVNIENSVEFCVGTIRGMEKLFVKLDRPVADGYIQCIDALLASIVPVNNIITISAVFHRVWTLK